MGWAAQDLWGQLPSPVIPNYTVPPGAGQWDRLSPMPWGGAWWGVEVGAMWTEHLYTSAHYTHLFSGRSLPQLMLPPPGPLPGSPNCALVHF